MRTSDVVLECLKQVLSQAPVLAYSTSEGAFVLDTDGSNTGIGAVLSWKQGEEKKVIACFGPLTRKKVAVPSNSCEVPPPPCLRKTFQSADRSRCTEEGDELRRQMARWIERSWVYTTWTLSTAKGETMEKQMAFPDVSPSTGEIVNAVSRKKECLDQLGPVEDDGESQ